MSKIPSISILEAARRLGISRGTIYNRAKRKDAARIKLTKDGQVPLSEVERLLRSVAPAMLDEAAVLARLDEYLTRYATRTHLAAIVGVLDAARDVADADQEYLLDAATKEELNVFHEGVRRLEHAAAQMWDTLRFEPIVLQFRRAALDARINPPADTAGAD